MAWALDDVGPIEMEPADSAGDLVTIRVTTPVGPVLIMGEIDIVGRQLFVKGVHIESDSGARSIGMVNLRTIARAVLKRIDCDEARVEGATRTTGANPGHRPRALRFTR